MSDHTIAVLLYILAGLNVLVALVAVAMVGKPRNPPTWTAKGALYAVVATALVCSLEVLAAGRLWP